MTNIFKRDKTFSRPVNWITTFFMVAFHIGAVAALFTFGWKPFLVAILLWWVAGSLGVGMGYHRLLTHRGFKTPKWVEYFLTTPRIACITKIRTKRATRTPQRMAGFGPTWDGF